MVEEKLALISARKTLHKINRLDRLNLYMLLPFSLHFLLSSESQVLAKWDLICLKATYLLQPR